MGGNAEWTDGDLARAITARAPGSAEAESELYRRFAPRVRLYGLRHLRNDDVARDLAQQVLLVTIEKLRNGSVRDADQIAVMEAGRVIETGRHDALMAADGAYARLHRLQLSDPAGPG